MIDLTSAYMALNFAFVAVTMVFVLAMSGAAVAYLMRKFWRSR